MSKYLVYDSNTGKIWQAVDQYRVDPDGTIYAGVDGVNTLRYPSNLGASVLELTAEQSKSLDADLSKYLITNGQLTNNSNWTPQPSDSLGAIPVEYDEMTSVINAVKLMLASGDIPVTTSDAKITVSGLYSDWMAGNHTVGEIYNAVGQTWECYQAYDNSVYPDITPENPAWHTFNRPLHGKSRETARVFVKPTGSHNIYRKGEWMIFANTYWVCKIDTAYSPVEYAQAWENKG